MDMEDVAYLQSLPEEEATRILHARTVALQMRTYQKTRSLRALAVLTYGSDKVFDRSVRSLGVSFVTAYLGQPLDERSVVLALTHCVHLDHTNTHTAAILMANLVPEYVAQTAQSLDVTTETVETALTLGIAELLDAGQLTLLSVMSLSLYLGAVASSRLRNTAT